MIEEGYAWPGTVTVASDSHSNMYGGVGCLETFVVRTDGASNLGYWTHLVAISTYCQGHALQVSCLLVSPAKMSLLLFVVSLTKMRF